LCKIVFSFVFRQQIEEENQETQFNYKLARALSLRDDEFGDNSQNNNSFENNCSTTGYSTMKEYDIDYKLDTLKKKAITYHDDEKSSMASGGIRNHNLGLIVKSLMTVTFLYIYSLDKFKTDA
jgi:hypothetical protein